MGIITKIEAQKKNNQRVNIYIDGGFVCGLTLETVILRRLKVGAEADEDELKQAVTEDEKKRAFNALLNSLAAKTQTKKQAEEYLFKKEFIAEAVEYAVGKAVEYGYVDDEKYAEQYLSVHGGKSGKLKIKSELFSRGINAEIIENLLRGYDDGGAAYELLSKYLRGEPPADIKEKNRAARYLAGKGCSYAAIKNAFERLEKGEDTD
ncbi:MAG: RecX family transcriptional regulator [Clostridiales bacterium]|jgi:regulatory protein|nr:RecX family transcriptional regulator [Clostridiales bacterium]